MPTADSDTRPPVPLVLATLIALPGAYLGAAGYLGLPAPSLPAPVAATAYGLAIVGAAFLLSWAAEAVQVDINAGMALALLALVAVLPEYAVDFVFTMQCGAAYAPTSGTVPEVCSLSLANMTGANRVLVGVGWPLVVLVAALAVWHARRSGRSRADSTSASTGAGDVRLAPAMSVEVVFLGLATLYSLTLPLKSELTLWDSVVLVTIFCAYAWRLSRMEKSEPYLLGTSAWVGGYPTRSRRAWTITMFVVAAVFILLTAEHFAEGLVATGDQLGVSKFVLVQWVAPLASESPELLVACLYAWRLKAADAFGTLLSSKVNQWTLLVGGLPIVFALSALRLDGLPLDTEQRFELLITGAQSLFAVAILLRLRLSVRGALALLSLFLVQFFVSVLAGATANRVTIVVLSVVYALGAVAVVVRHRSHVVTVVKNGLVTPFAELPTEPVRQ